MKKLQLLQKSTRLEKLFFPIFLGIALVVFNGCENKKPTSKNVIIASNLDVENSSSSSSSSSFNFFPSDAYKVPHDVLHKKDSGQVALSRFAWQEFIALSWPSSYNTTTFERGKPDVSRTVSDFLAIKNSGQLVWQTYKHRVEMYPKDTTKFNKTFNSAPQYFYDVDGQTSITSLDPSSTTSLRNVTTIFNNLDETSEINLCTLFVDGNPDAPGAENYTNPGIASGLPGAPRRMLYEAKGNGDMFTYVKNNHLYDSITRSRKITYTANKIKNDHAGAVYPAPDSKMISFPFGKNGGTEGSIEIKATWRQLTLKEYKSGRYLTAPILYYRQGKPGGSTADKKTYYDIVPAVPTYLVNGSNSTLTSLPYGLVGLHIIHKTVNFPSYVFATFEQVDNLNTAQQYNNLFYYNRNSNPSVNPNKQYAYRANPILQGTKQVNNAAHTQIKALNASSVWQYYKLIGVQGHPQNNANSTDYFLSNIMTETNQTLRDFSGTLDTLRGTFNPTAINLYQGKKVFVQGGCKGCHGNAQDADFSFITKQAPFEGKPDFINQPLLKSGQ